jgi:hypothetical protein
MFKLFFFHIFLIVKFVKNQLMGVCHLGLNHKIEKKLKKKNHRTMVVQVYSEMNMLLINCYKYDVGGFVKVMCKTYEIMVLLI